MVKVLGNGKIIKSILEIGLMMSVKVMEKRNMLAAVHMKVNS
jgi:hypothetical protein